MNRALLLWAALLVGACSSEFDPRGEAAVAVSVWGFVDVAADTQWVRVDRIREALDPDLRPLDATVTLEEIETGRAWPLRDSVVTSSLGRTVRLYWAVADVEPFRTYRLRIEGPEVGRSVAVATAPDSVRTFGVRRYKSDAEVTIAGVEHYADVQAIYTLSFRDALGAVRCCETRRVSYLRDLHRTVGVDRVFIRHQEDVESFGRSAQLVDAAVLVAAAGPEWPDLPVRSGEALYLPDLESNVESGVGFFGAVATRTQRLVTTVP